MQNVHQFGSAVATDNALIRNRVLRNTYWLLALSMIPTVLGAAMGVMSRDLISTMLSCIAIKVAAGAGSAQSPL